MRKSIQQSVLCAIMCNAFESKIVSMGISWLDSEPRCSCCNQTETDCSHVEPKADAEPGAGSDIANGVEASKTRPQILFNLPCVFVAVPKTLCSVQLWSFEG